MPDSTISVAVIAPSPAIRAGLRALLQVADEINVLYEGSTLPESGLLPEINVTILASTVDMSSSGLERWLAVSECRAMLFLGGQDLSPAVTTRLSAWGVLSIEADAEELIAAIHSLNAGLCVGEANLLRRTFSSAANKAPGDPLPESLTSRETEILQLVAAGLANKEIAVRLHISDQTVKYHIASVYSKLGVSSRTEAVRLGVHLGLVIL